MAVKRGVEAPSLSRVDDRYVPKTQIGTDFYANVRILRQPTDDVNPTGSGRKITFGIPNSGLLSLKDMAITANLVLTGSPETKKAPVPFIDGTGLPEGSVWKWDGTGNDPDPSFPDQLNSNVTYVNNIGAALSDKFFMSLIERIVVQTGGTVLYDTRDLNLISHLQTKLGYNSSRAQCAMSTYEGYDADNSNRVSGVPFSGYWENENRLFPGPSGLRNRGLRSAEQPIVIRPFAWLHSLFNGADGVFPTQFMPNITIEIYFADPSAVLKQQVSANKSYRGYNTSLSGRVHYYLSDVKMEVLLCGSNTLEKALISQGMSMTYSNFTTYTKILNSTAGQANAASKLSLQVPVTFRAVEQVYLIFRRVSDINDITKGGKLSSYFPLQRELVVGNIRINGIRRYGEDLNSRGAFLELARLHPEIKGSDLFLGDFSDWNKNNQIIVLSAQMDYSRELLSGIKTASQTSPLLVDLEFTKLTVTDIELTIVVQYKQWLSISREAIEVIN